MDRLLLWIGIRVYNHFGATRATKKAYALLLRYMTEEQRREFQTKGIFRCIGNVSKSEYVLYNGLEQVTNKTATYGTYLGVTYTTYPRNQTVPFYDGMLTKKLLIE